MTFLSNTYLYHGYGGQHDVSMTPLDYKDMLDVLHEDRLSKSMSLKFKKASQSNTVYSVTSFIPTLAISYLASRWVFGKFYQGVNRNKLVIPVMGVLCYWDYWRRMNRPIKRRLYTEIITDQTQDGLYIRERLREKTPALWSHLSKQLFDLNYRFPEMQELGVQIPTSILE